MIYLGRRGPGRNTRRIPAVIARAAVCDRADPCRLARLVRPTRRARQSPGAATRAGGAAGRAEDAAAARRSATSPPCSGCDNPTPPQLTAADEVYEFLFSGVGQNYADLKAKADKQEPLPPIELKDVSITSQRRRRLRRRPDPPDPQRRRHRRRHGRAAEGHLRPVRRALRSHRLPEVPRGTAAAGWRRERRAAARARRARRRSAGDIINNGADDDGSGTVALMGIAKAFATGPKPKRSLMFVWHAGEEAGLLRLALHGRLSGRAARQGRRRSSTST